METIDRVKALIEQGHEDRIKATVEVLEAVLPLTEELQLKLQAIGDNPISSPAIFAAIKASEEEGKSVIALATLSESEILKFSALEMGAFIYAVEQRVTGLRDDKGIFKATVNTEGCKLPNFIQADKIRKMMISRDKAMQAWISATPKDKPKEFEAFEKSLLSLSDYTFEVSGLDKANLSDWEQQLVISQVIGTANDAFLCATGKPLTN